MAVITAPVGDPRKGAVNHQLDVLTVQAYLNNWILYGALNGRVALLTSGRCDAAMIEAIRMFQKVVVGMPSPDGRIDPNRKTFNRLTGQVTKVTAAQLKQVNWKQHQPIFYKFELLMAENFPFLTRLGYSKHWSGMWAFVDRTTKSGGRSDHAEGRGIDVYLSAFKPDEKALGDGLFEMFLNNSRPLGVDHVIWNRRIWSQDKGGPRAYTNAANGPHTDHVHVSFTRPGSQVQPALLARLIPDLRRKLDLDNWNSVRRIEGFENLDPEDISPYD